MNKLFYGDNLDILRKFVRDETVDLCYIDPPFNSKRNYNQIYNNIGTEDRAQAQAFVDTWSWWGEAEGPHRKDSLAEQALDDILTNKNGVQTQQSINLTEGLLKVLGRGSLMAYLVAMTVRIAEIHRVVKQTGSFYLHCDPTASHYLKLVCDAVFVPQGGDYLNEVIWKRTGSHGGAKRFGPIHDILFFYAKSDRFTWNRVFETYRDEYLEKFYRFEDEKGRYRLVSLTGAGIRHGDSGKEWRGVNPTGVGRHWAVPIAALREAGEDIDGLSTQQKLDLLDKHELIYFPPKGSVPQQKRYIKVTDGVPVQDVISDILPISSQAQERLGYPTQKPEALLERIISASSNEGDVVLDAFCGCGTTIAVADRLKRNWIGMDITYQSVSLILKRLRDHRDDKSLQDVELHGVPRDMESVDALINKRDDRVRKEFEKWAVLSYSDNRAVINDKKGADGGIDGIAFLKTGKDTTEKILFSVKSGNIGRAQVGEFRGTIEREGAIAGILITRHKSTAPMVKEAHEAGKYKPDYAPEMERLQIVTAQQIIDGARLNLPLLEEVSKKAQKAKGEAAQLELNLE